MHNLCVFALFLPLLKKILTDKAAISHEAWQGNAHQITEDGVCCKHNQSLIMHDLCIFLICFCSKIIFTKTNFLFAEINLTNWLTTRAG